MKKFIPIFFSILVGACLSLLFLLNFHFIYELNPKTTIIIFLSTVIIFSIGTVISTRLFIIPFFKSFSKTKNSIFILIMSVILFFVLHISSLYYWSIPQVHNVDICFSSEDTNNKLKINVISDAKTNHKYSPNFFGYSNYPLIINNNSCINGNLLAIIEKNTIWNGFTLKIEENVTTGMIKILLNNTMTSYNLNEKNLIENKGKFIINKGAQFGEAMVAPWNSTYFNIIKWIGLAISSISLAAYFFGITEYIIQNLE